MRTVTPMQAEPDRRLAYEEILVVLMLSLLASAVYAVLSLLEAPVRGTVVASANQSTQLARQVAGFVFGLAPVFLVLYLVRRSGEGVGSIGLAWDRPRQDVLRGVALFAVVGLAGLGLYLGAVELGVNRFVVPAPPLGHWWTVPVLVLNAVEAALVEEIIVLGYLISRLRQLEWSPPRRWRPVPCCAPPTTSTKAGVGSPATSPWGCCSACCSSAGVERGRS